MGRGVRFGAFISAGLAVAVALALLVSPQASSQPDGLERIAIDHGFAASARAHALDGLPTTGYEVDGIDGRGLSTGVAGVVGVAVTFALASGLLAVLRRRSSRAGSAPAE